MLHRIIFSFAILMVSQSYAITLSSSQNDFVTTADITTTINNSSGAGINNTISGTNSSPRKITNLHTITTNGSGAYAIRTTGNYNQVKNQGIIVTNNSSGRGISIGGDFSSATNLGAITTKGSSSYGIYVSAGTNSEAVVNNYSSVNNSGTIDVADAHGIYTKDNFTHINNSSLINSGKDSDDYGIITEGNNSVINNSGTINSTRYSIYNSGDGTIINNSGTLNGGVHVGNAILNINGGAINGEINGSKIATVNINNDFVQRADFADLNLLNINFGTLDSNNKIEAKTIFIDRDATLKVNSKAIIDGEIRGNGTLNIASNTKFSTTNDLSIGNVVVDGYLDLSKENNLNINGNLINKSSGIIDVGTNDQKVTGNFSLLEGSTLKISGNNNGFGSLDVNGSATIDQNTKLIISSAGRYLANNQKINLISAGEGSLLNNISTIEVNNCRSNSCGLLRISTEVSGNNLLLSVNRVSANEIAVNNNSKKIYENLSSNNNGKAGDFLNYLDSKNFSNAELESTLNQLAPQSGKARSIGNINVIGNSLKTSEMRLDKIRIGTDQLPAQGVANFSQIFSPTRQLDIFNLDQQGGALKNGFWVQPFGGSALQNSTSSDVGYKTTLSGVSFGIDHEFSSRNTSGAALSIARAQTKSLDSLKRSSAVTYQFNLYNSHNFDKFFLDSFGGIALSQYSSDRSIPAVSSSARANYSGMSYIAKLRAGITHKINEQLNFIPEISASFMHNQVGKYEEKGADSLNLKVGSTKSNILEGRFGAAISWLTKTRESSEFKKIITVFRSSYGYNFINHYDDVVSGFSGQNSTFNSQVSPLDPGSFRIGAEINGYHIEDTIFSIDYQFEKRITYHSHFVSLKILQQF